MLKQTFSTHETAHLLAISESMVDTLLDDGKLYYRVENGNIRIPGEQLNGFANMEMLYDRLLSLRNNVAPNTNE